MGKQMAELGKKAAMAASSGASPPVPPVPVTPAVAQKPPSPEPEREPAANDGNYWQNKVDQMINAARRERGEAPLEKPQRREPSPVAQRKASPVAKRAPSPVVKQKESPVAQRQESQGP